MNGQLVHPDADRLAAFARGQLDLDEIDAIQQHLAACDSCCQAVGEVPDDPLLALVRQASVDEAQAEGTPASTGKGGTDQTVCKLEEQTTDEASLTGSQPADIDGTTDPRTATEVPPELAEHPRYRVQRRIGKGGMGDVYLAEHRLMQRTVALKVINRGLVGNPQAVARFRREVQAAASLSHPNIVSAYDAEQAGDVHFLAMEFVVGTNLSEVVKARGPLSVIEACDFVRQAAIGLQHAHERGMIHRDIKPHNLMLTAEATVKILDFGLASLSTEAADDDETKPLRGDLTTWSTVIGTPDYISPEQAADAHAADIRSDVYSLGATLYFLLAGRPPFTEGTVKERLANQAVSKPESIRDLRDDIPDELAATIERMLAKDPEDRFQSAAEVAETLGRLLAGAHGFPGEPIAAPAVLSDESASPSPLANRSIAATRNWWSRSVTWIRRYRLASAASAATVVVALAICIGGVVFGPLARMGNDPKQDRVSANQTDVGARTHSANSAPDLTYRPLGDRPELPSLDELRAAPLADKFNFDFRGARFDTQDLLMFCDSAYAASLFRPEQRGLRICVPGSQVSSKPRLGFAPLRRIHGDFEISASYEILANGNPGLCPGVGPNMYLLAEQTLNSAHLRRCARLDTEAHMFSWRTTHPVREDTTRREYFAAKGTTGSLRFVRVGGLLYGLVAEGPGDKFHVLDRVEFGTTPIGMLRLESVAEGARETVDIVWTELTIRAERLEVQNIPALQATAEGLLVN